MKNLSAISSVLLLSLTITIQAQPRPGEDFSKYFSKNPEPSSVTTNFYLERAGSFPYGPSITIAVDSVRHLVFVSSGGAALIYDGTDPSNLLLLTDTLRTEGLVFDLAYDDITQRLYLACGDGGFEIWDVQNPYQPIKCSNLTVTFFDVPTPVERVYIRNNIAVVEGSWAKVHTIDVTDPYNPVIVGFIGSMGNPAIELYVEPAEYVHTTGANGYYRYYMDNTGTLYDAGLKYFDYGAGAVFADHDVAYVDYHPYMYILDLHTGPFLPWSVTDVNGINHIEVRNHLAYITNGNGLNIWDVSNPSNPFWISTIPLTDDANDFVIAGDYLYAAESYYGYEIVNIADPANPYVVNTQESLSFTRKVKIVGNYAYLSHFDDGVFITDISNVDYPVQVGRYNTPGTTEHLTVQDNILYVADWDDGFRIADVSDPSNPVELSNVPGFNAWRVEVSGNYAYVIEGIYNVDDNLRIFNVSDPFNPVQVSSTATPGDVNKIIFKNNHLFLASKSGGFRILDVSNPINPVEVSHMDFPTYAEDLCLRDNHVFLVSLGIGGPESGLHIIDISDLSNPVEIGSYTNFALTPFMVQVSGDYAYISDSHDLLAFYISDLTNPIYLERIKTPDIFYGGVAVDSLIFISDQRAGLQIYKNILFSQPGGGLNWHIQMQETTEGFTSIFFNDLNVGWAAGYSGKFYHTTDGGNNWIELQSGITGDIHSIYFFNSQTGWFVASSGQIFNTDNGGTSWHLQTSGTSNELFDIKFVNETDGWAVGDETILHTTDGGINWASQTFPPGILDGFYSVDFVDSLHGWVADLGDFGKILKTTNGGSTWTALTGLSDDVLFALDFVNQNTGYVVGMFGGIIKTTDGGTTWVTQDDPPPHDWLYDVQFMDEEYGWIVGFNGKIIYTTDGGDNWLQQTSGTTAQLNSLYFTDRSHGWAAGEDENGGIILNYSLEITPVELTSFTAIANNNSITLSWQTSTEKNNSGFEIQRKASSINSQWKNIRFVEGHGTTAGLNNYSFVDANLKAGQYLYRLKQIDFDGSFKYSNTVDVNVLAPVKYSLEQNYPNPFNPSTTIEYSIPKSGKVNLAVFNILGEKVINLINEYKEAGNYKVNFNAERLSSGIYFYKITAGNFNSVRKMILLK